MPLMSSSPVVKREPQTSNDGISAASASDALDLRFLNHCLSNATQVHFLVTSSFAGEEWQSSCLLEADAQAYMVSLLSRYAASAALRAQLLSGDSLYYLQCLTEEGRREDFLRVAASPLFPFASPE